MRGDLHIKDSVFGTLKENLKFWPNLAFAGYITLVFIKVFYPSFPYLVIIMLGCSLLASQLFYLLEHQKNLLLICFIYFIFGSFIVAFGDGTMLTPLNVFNHLGLCTLLIRYKLNSNIVKIFLALYAAYCTYQSIFLNANLNEIAGGSRNLLGWIGLGLGLFYYAIKFRNNEKPDLWTAILVLYVALICIGRGNIIGSIFLLILVTWDVLRDYKSSKKVLIAASLVSVLIVVSYLFSDFIEDRTSYFENKGFESGEREFIFENYIQKIDGTTLFVGVSPNQYPFTILEGNFHNSFLLGHSNFGVLFLVFMLFFIYSIFFRGGNIYLKGLILIFSLRAFTDTILFVGFFDFVYIYLFYTLYYSKNLLYGNSVYHN